MGRGAAALPADANRSRRHGLVLRPRAAFADRSSASACWPPPSAAPPGRRARPRPRTGLLFYLSADHGTTADFSAGGTPAPNFDYEVTSIPDGAKGPALQCGDLQRLAWWAPGNIYAQRGTLSFFWRSRYPVGPTQFPVFRVGFGDHSSWDMVWLRIDYNGHGFDAFVTDASLARTRVSVTLQPFPQPDEWTHLAISWDETRGIRFYVNGKLAAKDETVAVYNTALDQFGPHSRIISPYNVQSDYNFVRGGDIDEIRIYDRMLDDADVATLAAGRGGHRPAPAARPRPGGRPLARRMVVALRLEPARRSAAVLRRPGDRACARSRSTTPTISSAGGGRRATASARRPGPAFTTARACPAATIISSCPTGIVTSQSGQAITFVMPDEPWNHLEISGAAWGKMELLPAGTADETATTPGRVGALRAPAGPGEDRPRPRGPDHRPEDPLHQRRAGRAHRRTGRLQRHGRAASRPAAAKLSLPALAGPGGARRAGPRSAARLHPRPVSSPTNARRCVARADERRQMPRPCRAAAPRVAAARAHSDSRHLGPVHRRAGRHRHRPAGAQREADARRSVPAQHPGEGSALADAQHVRLHVQREAGRSEDRCGSTCATGILPPGKGLWITIAGAGADFSAASLAGAEVRLVFKPRAAARAEHELDRFTQARDSYAMLVEEHPHSPKFNLWNRFEADLTDLLRVDPDHYPGRQYAAVAMDWPRPPYQQPDAAGRRAALGVPPGRAARAA